MKLKKLLLSLMAATTIMGGCGTSLYHYKNVSGAESNYQYYKEIPVYMDKNFSESERASMLQAMGEWNHVLNGHMKMVVKDMEVDIRSPEMKALFRQVRATGEGYMILKLNHDDPMLGDAVEEDDGTLAFVNSLGHRGHIMVVIADRIGSRNLTAIALHEFGHLFGAMHVLAKSLMYPAYSGRSSYHCVDKITMMQVANYQEIDPTHLNYCVTPNLD